MTAAARWRSVDAVAADRTHGGITAIDSVHRPGDCRICLSWYCRGELLRRSCHQLRAYGTDRQRRDHRNRCIGLLAAIGCAGRGDSVRSRLIRRCVQAGRVNLPGTRAPAGDIVHRPTHRGIAGALHNRTELLLCARQHSDLRLVQLDADIQGFGRRSTAASTGFEAGATNRRKNECK